MKQILSLSLHEVARILHGSGVSVDDELLPMFEDMIQVLPAVVSTVPVSMCAIISLLCLLGRGVDQGGGAQEHFQISGVALSTL